ncbi:type II toxin-antitoxin system mRNA interferase toxin, RelE/StbE family [Salmonella enterica subsp. enterica]|nr:type II toxin-antitoxin system mRNA interferase toxin, RelE/StbE family [Salmonella enterica subsp. enterica]
MNIGTVQKEDVKRAQKRHKDVGKLKTLMTLLIRHPLFPFLPFIKITRYKGSYSGYRDAHIGPDWILIDKITDECLRFDGQERMPIYFKSAVFAHMLTGAFRFYD